MRVHVDAAPPLVKARLDAGDALDHTNARIAREEICAALIPGGRLILDFGTVRSIDSGGVGALVAVLKAVRRGGGRMVLIGLHPQVLSELKTIRLTTVFEILPDEAAAIIALETTPVTSR